MGYKLIGPYKLFVIQGRARSRLFSIERMTGNLDWRIDIGPWYWLIWIERA